MRGCVELYREIAEHHIPDTWYTSRIWGSPQMPLKECNPMDERLRFVARLGLVEFWLATNRWPDCVDEVPCDCKGACAAVRHIAREVFGF